MCSYSGAYKGLYNGTYSGHFGVLVDASTGDINSIAYDTNENDSIYFAGDKVTDEQNQSFTLSGDNGSTVNGEFTSSNSLAGTWASGTSTGTGPFSADRIGYSSKAMYRFTGALEKYQSETTVFTVDIDSDNNLVGSVYTLNDYSESKLTGTLDGNEFTGTDGDGHSFSGTLDLEHLSISGNSSDGSSFSAKGCKL